MDALWNAIFELRDHVLEEEIEEDDDNKLSTN